MHTPSIESIATKPKFTGKNGRALWRKYEKEMMNNLLRKNLYPDTSAIQKLAEKMGRPVGYETLSTREQNKYRVIKMC